MAVGNGELCAPSRLVLVLGELTFALGMKIMKLSFIYLNVNLSL